MNGQMDMFDYLQGSRPGDWVTKESGKIGGRMTFDEIAASVGKLIVLDMNTESRACYKVVLAERIVMREGQRRLIYYDGKKQRGLINEMYFNETDYYTAKAYRLNNTNE